MNIRRLTAIAVAGFVILVAGLVTPSVAEAAPRPDGAAPNDLVYVQLINKNSRKCLGPQNSSEGSFIVQRRCDRSDAQHWGLEPLPNGYYRLRNRATQYCLDLQANSVAEVHSGTMAQQFRCVDGAPLETWWFNVASFPYYQVVTLVNSLCLDVQGRSSDNGARVQVYACKANETAQQFDLL
jgi:hypothetical protein